MSFDPKPEWHFQTSRRGLLRFLSGATLIGGAAAAAKVVPEPAEGIVKIATPEDARTLAEPTQRVRYDTGGGWPPGPFHQFDIVPWRIFDTVWLSEQTPPRAIFFQHSKAQYPGAVTNLYRPGMLCAPESFALSRLWVILMGHRMVAERFAQVASLRLIVGHKIRLEVPVTDICRYQMDDSNRCMDFGRIPKIINYGVPFSAELEIRDYERWDLTAQCILDGLMARGIQ